MSVEQAVRSRPTRILASVALGIAASISLLVLGPSNHAQGSGSCQIHTQDGGSGQNFYYDPDDWKTTYYGHERGDYIEMRNCGDTVWAGQGPDQVHGATGNDYVNGQDGNDSSGSCDGISFCGKLFGGNDDDVITGGMGNDGLDDSDAGGDVDDLYANEDDDTLHADDGDGLDALQGGTGIDTCYRDAGDSVGVDCP